MMSVLSSRRISHPVAAKPPAGTTTYQVWLTEEQSLLVDKAIAKSDDGWAEWVKKAIDRLKREEHDELKGLIGGIKRTSREGKVITSFRLYGSTLDEVRSLAKDFQSNVQTVLSTAFFMQALAPLINVNEPFEDSSGN